jgi:hypothetical protein
MSAREADVVTILARETLGDRVLVIAVVRGGTWLTARSLQLHNIDYCWTQNVSDDGAIAVSDYSGSTITYTEVDNDEDVLFFLIGY